MTVRITYEHELEELNKDLREMAFMVEKAIEQTFVAFEDQNYTLAEDVIKGDRTVNDMERAIESRCLSLILRQQPVACDLRQISTALKVVTDLERIGDHASDIAELILRIKSEHAYHIVKHLPLMAEEARKMVHDAVEAFISQDLEDAENIAGSGRSGNRSFDGRQISGAHRRPCRKCVRMDRVFKDRRFEACADHVTETVLI